MSDRDTLREIIERQWELAAELAAAVAQSYNGCAAHGARSVQEALTRKLEEMKAR